MTSFYALICGEYDESKDMENDSKDKNEPLYSTRNAKWLTDVLLIIPFLLLLNRKFI